MDDSLRHMHNSHDIIYVVDAKRVLPDAARLHESSYRFNTPTNVTGTSISSADIDIGIMDSEHSALIWGLMNPFTSYAAYTWVMQMTQLVINAVNEHAPVGIVLHYAATMLLWQLPASILDKLPVFIIYHAPGLISHDIPWVFDSLIKEPTFTLYEKTKDYNDKCLRTWYSYYNKITMQVLTPLTPQTLRSKLRKIHHVFCWDKSVTQPIKSAYKDLHIYQPGALYTDNYARARWYNNAKKTRASNAPNAPNALKKWLSVKAPTILVSFGSYSATSTIKHIQQFVLNALNQCGVRVLYHATTEASATNLVESASLKIHHGWLPYEWIVPKCDAVVFTGSVCLQSICAYNATPMIFIPLLSEQFFWAHNYYAMTGTPFINYKNTDNDAVINTMRAWLIESKSARTQKYLKICANNMKAHDGSIGVASIIKQIVSI
jgi:hypothetical protein